MRPFPHRTGLLNRPLVRSKSTLRRRMSVKGAIKKTRSIAVERESENISFTRGALTIA